MYVAVQSFPLYDNRDGYIGRRVRVLSTHETVDAAWDAINATFNGEYDEMPYYDSELPYYVALASSPLIPYLPATVEQYCDDDWL